MKVTFVILHYQNIQDTYNCIESIKLQRDYKDAIIEIIIVDNNSPNGTGKIIQEEYKNDSQIKIILLDENVGFSKGNNIGYAYAQNNNADIIIMSNNDIIIEDQFFIKKLLELNLNNTQIVVPKIVNFNGNQQNPLRLNFWSLKKAYKNLFYKQLIVGLYNIPIISGLVYKFESKRLKKWEKNYYLNNDLNLQNRNFVPHGAFIIFLKEWIKNEKIAFPSDTFMYAEEDFLALYIHYKSYIIKMKNELQVRHLEGRSTVYEFKDEFKRHRMVYQRQIQALKKYIKFYKGLLNG